MKTIIIDGVEYNLTPKALFKKGDWITNGDYTWKVTDIQPLDYILQSQNGDTIDDTISYVDEYFHLWTIQDAKDGDVLMSKAPFIFNGNLEGGIGCPGAHCGINTLGKFQIPKYPEHWTGHATTPATKEQRDFLFQKMREADYEWDADKKELKNIERKSAWTEEDEKEFEQLLDILHANGYESFDNWLKSLKDRFQLQPKQEWSEYDKIQLDEAIQMIEANGTWIRSEDAVKKVSNWLKSLKPQNRWKPTKEQMSYLNQWLKNHRYDGDSRQTYQVFKSLYNDLKSL